MKYFALLFNSLIIKVGLLLLTFLIGVAGTLLLHQNSTPTVTVENLPPKITFCQLAQNSEYYNDEIIQVEGNAENLDGLIHISDENCQMVNVLGAQDKTYPQPEELPSKLNSGKFRARILVTGEFDSEETQGCFGTKFAIRATSIKLK
jgi:hypothetical protein